VSETSSRENNARVEAVTRMSTEKSGCDWNTTWPYNALLVDVVSSAPSESSATRTEVGSPGLAGTIVRVPRDSPGAI
jgi:hypothetical protein